MTKKLSVIIPVYNEEETISTLMGKVLGVQLPDGMGKELIVVNDCSTDRSDELIGQFIQSHPDAEIKYIRQKKNQGKGMAIRTAIPHLTGDYTIIQDADLETEPEDYNLMLPLLLSGEHDVVYGSRFLSKGNRHTYRTFYIGGAMVSKITNLLYGQKITDEPTCYKMFKTSLLQSIPLKCTRFEFCPEVTAKVSKAGHKIAEVPIHYYPRSIAEGKKIKWYDGIEAIWTLIKYRFTD